MEKNNKKMKDLISTEIDLMKDKLFQKIGQETSNGHMVMSEFVSAKNVLEMLAISKPTLLKYTQEGYIKRYKLGNKTFYRRNEILEAIKFDNLKKE